MEPITNILGLPFKVSTGRGGWLCSNCNGGVRAEALTCKHCQASFADVPRAHAIYQDALQALKANPTNADLRQRALSVGRAYSFLTRQSNITVYDEMAVMNDIAAATAGAGAPASAPDRETIEARLARLNDLHTKGLVNDQEWNERRQKILDEL
jgi:hypothetical protein